MKTNTLFFLVAAVLLAYSTDARSTRGKRNVIELAEVISCVDRFSPIEVWLNLDGYGCYCGLGGKGTPLDEVDQSCLEHDYCYDRAMKNGDCPGNMAYTTTYQYEKHLCKTPESDIVCDPAGSYKRAEVGNCAEDLCRCDAALAQRLRGLTLDPKYRKYKKDTC